MRREAPPLFCPRFVSTANRKRRICSLDVPLSAEARLVSDAWTITANNRRPLPNPSQHIWTSTP